MNRLEIGSSAFDQMSLHDVRIYALFLQRQEYEANLILDIDYIAEWNCFPDKQTDFLIVPATLTFLDVVDLQIRLDWGASLWKGPHGVGCCLPGELTIYDFRRCAYTDPVYVDQSYLRYELDFSEPPDGRISLGAKDFKIVGRQEGVHSNQQTLDPVQRTPLMMGG